MDAFSKAGGHGCCREGTVWMEGGRKEGVWVRGIVREKEEWKSEDGKRGGCGCAFSSVELSAGVWVVGCGMYAMRKKKSEWVGRD